MKTGSPGSSYTFSIAERIGMEKRLIQRARKLADESHYQLDQLLNKSEQQWQEINIEKTKLNKLLKENEQLKKEMQFFINKEQHQQEVEKLKLTNKIAEDKITYLKDMERKLKALVFEWRKAEDKDSVVKMIASLLMNQKDKFQSEKHQKKMNEKFEEVSSNIEIGSKVKMKQNKQIGIVKEIRGKKALLQVGIMPMLVELKDLVVVVEKEEKS